MSKKILVLQDGIKDCGSACLLSIIRYYGGNISLDKLLELTNTTKEGTNFYNLKQAATEIGFEVKGYKIDDINDLSMIESPFISQMIINNYYHFVVIYKINNNKITIMDPAKGMISLSYKELNNLYTGNILTLKPIKKLPIYENNNYLINNLKKIIYNNKKLLIFLIFQTIISIIFTCIYSYYFQIIIDKILSTNIFNLLVISIIFIIILFIKNITEYLRNNLLLYLNQKIDLSIITTTINKIISLPYSYYKNKTTGEIVTRINDLFYIKNIISKLIITIFLDIILSITVIIILFIINKKMTIILLSVILFYLIILLLYKNHIKSLTNTIQEDNAKSNSLTYESISGYESIKGLHLETIISNKINKNYLKLIKDNFTLNKLSNIEELLKNLYTGIINILIIYLGIKNVMDKSLTLGSLITYNSLIYYFQNPLDNLYNFYSELYYVKNSIKRINNILDYKYEKLDKDTNLSLKGDIIINNLNYSYQPHKDLIKDLTIKINYQDKVLLLGPSGIGKSTVLKLLYRYYEINRGFISINNIDINDFSLSDIRNNITYISQNEIIFTDTIRNNIIMNRNIKEEDFINVCHLTKVDEILTNNSLSYDYMLEENGANISGGQRQRIILARALLKKSIIYLIDEGLNEIDINLEKIILNNIFTYYHDKTFIIVSHRIENINMYNRVIHLDRKRD